MRNTSSYIYPAISKKILHTLQDESDWAQKKDLDKILRVWEAGKFVTYAEKTKFADFIINLLIKTGQVKVYTEKLYQRQTLDDVYKLTMSHARTLIQNLLIRPYTGKYKNN